MLRGAGGDRRRCFRIVIIKRVVFINQCRLVILVGGWHLRVVKADEQQPSG